MALLTAEHSAPPPRRPPRFAAESLMSGLVAVPVRFADAGSTGYLRPGDRIDVLAARDAGPGGPSVRRPTPRGPAADVRHVRRSVRRRSRSTSRCSRSRTPRTPRSLTRAAPDDGGLVFLAVDNATAARLARAAVADRLSYALRHG